MKKTYFIIIMFVVMVIATMTTVTSIALGRVNNGSGNGSGTFANAFDLDMYKVTLWGDSITYGLLTSDDTVFNGANYVVDNRGVGGYNSTQIKTLFNLATSTWTTRTVIWSGHNDVASAVPNATVMSNIASMVSSLESVGNSYPIIVELIRGDYGAATTTQGIQYAELNSLLEATYGDRFLPVLDVLQANNNGSAEDLYNVNVQDIVPKSLRTDDIHLNSAGELIVNNLILDYLNSHESTQRSEDRSVSFADLRSIFAQPPAIGSSTLTFATTTVNGSLNIYDNLIVDTDSLYVDSNNHYVGINTTAPSTALEVVGTQKITSTNAAITTNYAANLTLFNPDMTENNGNGILFTGYDSGGTDPDTSANITSQITGRSTGITGRLIFGTSNNTANPSERMSISSNGYLAVGTTTINPKALIHAYHISNPFIVLDGNSPLYQTHVSLFAPTYAYEPSLLFSNGGNFSIKGQPYNDRGSISNAVSYITINSLIGTIGIGTTTPVTNLHVTASTTNATSTVTIGKTGQNKGSCLELFRSDGTAIYGYVPAGSTTFTLSETSCK